MSSVPRKTFVVNLIGGPGCGKSTLSAMIFAKLKLHEKKFTVEFVQEYAKNLVWTRDFDTLNNQYHVTQHQYKLLEQMNGHLDFIVTDGPVIQGLYYNLHNPDNVSDHAKTQKFILDCHAKFNNINIVLRRGNFDYEPHGRLQTEGEAREIDVILCHLLRQHDVKFATFEADASDEKIVDAIVYYILSASDTVKPVREISTSGVDDYSD